MKKLFFYLIIFFVALSSCKEEEEIELKPEDSLNIDNENDPQPAHFYRVYIKSITKVRKSKNGNF